MIKLMESDIVNERFIVTAGNFSYEKILTLCQKDLKAQTINSYQTLVA